MTKKVIGLFSGMGALELAFQQAGFEVVASNEVNPTICKTLKTNFKHQVLPYSIHKLSIDDLRKDFREVDGIIGGFPCLTYSTAADIHNTRVNVRYQKNDYKRYAKLGGDLFLHMARIIGEWQLPFFVIENVSGIQDAKIVMETFRNMPCNDKGNPLGYYYLIFNKILDTNDFGLPQRRKRLFIVGTRRDAVLNIRAPATRRQFVVGDILERNPDIEMPEYARRRLERITCRDGPIITKAGPDAIAPTVVAHYAKDKGTRLVQIGEDDDPNKIIRPYTVRECARLQGIPDSITIEGSESMRYRQVGNAVSVPVAQAIAHGIQEMFAN